MGITVDVHCVHETFDDGTEKGDDYEDPGLTRGH